jgi:hypothetical protein
VQQGSGRNRTNVLNWVDNSNHETGYTVRRAPVSTGPWTDLATVAADVTTYTDPIGNPADQIWFYQVFAINTVGYTGVDGYKTLTVTSAGSNIVQVPETALPTLPAAPTNLTAVVQVGPQVLLAWTDNADNETGFVIERAVGTGAFSVLVTVGANSTSYTDVAVLAGNNYAYRVAAVNAAGLSAYSNTASVAVALPPAAPTNVVATAALTRNGKNATITLTWTDVADETGYTIQLATDAAFTANVVTTSVGANVTTYTTGRLALVTPYYLRVLAYNGAGQSAWANATPFPITTPQ